MPFEVIHTPGELPAFDFAGAYFDTARRAEDRQRAQDQTLGLSLLRLAGQREGIQAANDRASASVDAANKRAADRLAFDREKANAEVGDLEGMTQAALGGLGLEPDQPKDPMDELASELGTGPEDGADAEPDHDPDDTAARTHPGYGVPVRLNRLPKTKAGYTILWNAIKAAQAQEKIAAEKAAKEAAVTHKRDQAGRIAAALGVGGARPPSVRPATPEEGGYLLQDPMVQEDGGDPGLSFDDPKDVYEYARLKQQQDAHSPATEAQVDAAARRLVASGRYKTYESARAVVESRMIDHLPVDLAGPRDEKTDFGLLIAKDNYERAIQEASRYDRPRPLEIEPKVWEPEKARLRAAVTTALRAYAGEYQRVYGDRAHVPEEYLPPRPQAATTPNEGFLSQALDILGDGAGEDDVVKLAQQLKAKAARGRP